MAPPERDLGNVIKLVYLHVAITWVGLAMFSLAGILGAAHLVSKKDQMGQVAGSVERTGIFFWMAHYSLGFVIMQLAWGGPRWDEPLIWFATAVMVGSVTVYVISLLSDDLRVSSAANLAFAGVLWFMLLRSGRIFHPGNAITASDEIIVKLIPGALTLLLFGLAYISSRWLLSKYAAQGPSAESPPAG